MPPRATLRMRSLASTKGLSASPRKGFTATKFWRGQRGAIRSQADRAASMNTAVWGAD